MKINLNRLKDYLSDLDPDTSIVDEAIATIEAVAENKTDDELYERERPLMIAYLALRIVKAGLNVSPQNNEDRGEIIPCGSCRHFRQIPDTDYGTCLRALRNGGSVMKTRDFCSYAELPLPTADDHDVSGLLDD